MFLNFFRGFRYLLGISLLAFLYSMAQLWRQARRFSTGKDLVPRNYSGIVDFAGDQVGGSFSIWLKISILFDVIRSLGLGSLSSHCIRRKDYTGISLLHLIKYTNYCPHLCNRFNAFHNQKGKINQAIMKSM